MNIRKDVTTWMTDKSLYWTTSYIFTQTLLVGLSAITIFSRYYRFACNLTVRA